MPITISNGFLTALNSDRFRRWNFLTPEQILSYWNFTVKVVDEYERESGIIPSQKRGGYLLEEIVRVSFVGVKNQTNEDFCKQPPVRDMVAF